MVLAQEDYNYDYFNEGYEFGYPLHRWYRMDYSIPWCTGEYYRDRAKRIFDFYGDLVGKKVLVLGCAYGYMITDLRSWGVDATGIDWSQYAYDNAEAEAKPYITLADARSEINNYKNNSIDLIVACEFLQCLEDTDIENFVTTANKKADDFYIIEQRNFVEGITTEYNGKTLEEWLGYLPPSVTFLWKDEEMMP